MQKKFLSFNPNIIFSTNFFSVKNEKTFDHIYLEQLYLDGPMRKGLITKHNCLSWKRVFYVIGNSLFNQTDRIVLSNICNEFLLLCFFSPQNFIKCIQTLFSFSFVFLFYWFFILFFSLFSERFLHLFSILVNFSFSILLLSLFESFEMNHLVFAFNYISIVTMEIIVALV